MPLHHPGPPPWIVNWTRPGRLLAADGVTLKWFLHRSITFAETAANGDRHQLFFISEGNETRLSVGLQKGNDRSIFDLYVNGVLDSAGYDVYGAAISDYHLDIALMQPIRSGKNIIELRINGKNVLSTNYVLVVYGASLQ